MMPISSEYGYCTPYRLFQQKPHEIFDVVGWKSHTAASVVAKMISCITSLMFVVMASASTQLLNSDLHPLSSSLIKIQELKSEAINFYLPREKQKTYLNELISIYLVNYFPSMFISYPQAKKAAARKARKKQKTFVLFENANLDEAQLDEQTIDAARFQARLTEKV